MIYPPRSRSTRLALYGGVYRYRVVKAHSLRPYVIDTVDTVGVPSLSDSRTTIGREYVYADTIISTWNSSHREVAENSDILFSNFTVHKLMAPLW